MNYLLSFLPERELKPRKKGLTMVMDKGLSIAQAEHLVSVAGHLIDFVKLGFGTSYCTQGLQDKIHVYKKSDIQVYFGGTLFEAFLIRDCIEDYIRLCRKYELKWVEISDGSVSIPHELKCNMIEDFSQHFSVLSEVGSKQADVILSDEQWVEQINKEMQAGSKYVIAEAREGGNVGVYDSTGKPKTDLIDTIEKHTDCKKLLWEAPTKPQQVWFIKKFGTHVNLGNIHHDEVIALETLRLGLRGDTFFDFIPENKRFF
jgi:phosphosulfolactate synthase